jgi:pyruvate/2-oxoglutarate dehydrogenase complex dihydrolipoamide acyltransferase (E2) component
MFADDGRIDMRLTFDHRAIDGAPVARALADMEAALHAEILSELRHMPRLERAA